ncbi:MAG: ATP-binding protein [Eubacterium sp.]
MNKTEKLKYYIETLCVYNLKDKPVIRSMHRLLSSSGNDDCPERLSEFFTAVCRKGSLKACISQYILNDDNAFTRSACAGKADKLNSATKQAVKLDLMKLEALSDFTIEDLISEPENEKYAEILETIPAWETGEAVAPLSTDWAESTAALEQYHRDNGYGVFARHIAFTWRNGKICPITSTDLITLEDLKNYEIQRQKVIDNTESFIKGHPANNVLLYGDRGTGKSSTVHALLNKYHKNGLRMIEIPKSAVADLGLIREAIAGSPMKFIIYIDDLSFDSNDSSFSELKAALEGSLSGRQTNTLIYATSNRRHLIKESFSDRENDINRNDIMQEQLSLSDRFGLTITFINPNKAEYLDIVQKIAADRKLKTDTDTLCAAADRWATRRGGRSPRCAKQFIDYAESCELQGKEL